MKILALVLVAASMACASIPTEHVRYMAPPLEATTAMQGGVPIVAGSIYNGMQTQPEVVLKKGGVTTAMSTSRIDPFAGLDGSQQTDKYIQDITVINLDTTGAVCLHFVSWATTCSAQTFTCLGATAPGPVVPAGAMKSYRFTGQGKVCADASEAATDAQLERTVLFANPNR